MNFNEISIIDFLAFLNIQPERIQTNQAWYKAFYRHEKTASLKVDIKKNVFYDFGEGFGGSTRQLAERIYGCRGKELDSQMDNLFSFPTASEPFQNTKSNQANETHLLLKEVKELQHPALLNYLGERKISLKVARYFCKEVHFSIREKAYFSIGFWNEKNGVELRNEFFKCSSSPKSFTLIKANSQRLLVFEGFMDFLSLLTLNKMLVLDFDFLILNSVNTIVKIESKKLESYTIKGLFLDNDEAGKKAQIALQNKFSNCYDFSFLYPENNDLNEWIMEAKSEFDFKEKQDKLKELIFHHFKI